MERKKKHTHTDPNFPLKFTVQQAFFTLKLILYKEGNVFFLIGPFEFGGFVFNSSYYANMVIFMDFYHKYINILLDFPPVGKIEWLKKKKKRMPNATTTATNS